MSSTHRRLSAVLAVVGGLALPLKHALAPANEPRTCNVGLVVKDPSQVALPWAFVSSR